MATHIISRRIQNIIQFINDSKFPSKSKMMEYLKDRDLNISSRTFDRDLERIRTDFGLEILYNKLNNGYYINEDKSIKTSSFFKFLEIISIADIFNNSLKDSNTILEYVSFDDSKYFKGLENLKTILLAINQGRKLKFVHENYILKTSKDYIITPLLLKEYENRWYVIGVPDGINEIRTFGIDRLTQLLMGKLSKLKKVQFQEKMGVFDNIIGLDYENNQPIKIRLLVNDPHINYMRSLPLHHSQVIHSENENGQYFVDFFLVPNYEFKTQVLKMGEDAVIVSPTTLKVEIKQQLMDTLKRYNE